MMSRDRVHFKLGGRGPFRIAAHNSLPIDIRAAQRAFGLTDDACGTINYLETTIVCRPSQFARFLIYRNEMGGNNDFKGLCARLVGAPVADRKIDVSENPAE